VKVSILQSYTVLGKPSFFVEEFIVKYAVSSFNCPAAALSTK